MDSVHIAFEQPAELVFNRARVRRAFLRIGQAHQSRARRLLCRRGRSQAGEPPRRQTGRLARSIGYAVPRPSARRPGFMVKIAPNQKGGEGSTPLQGAFYPSFLHHGVRHAAYGMPKPHRRQKRHHHTGGWRLAPRNNYMVEVLRRLQGWTRVTLLDALKQSLRPQRRQGKNA
ncbi:MAG: hypothetical protein HamCj_10660 [Candidatus Hamiltonella defensa (Ceratovacuna japonica)]